MKHLMRHGAVPCMAMVILWAHAGVAGGASDVAYRVVAHTNSPAPGGGVFHRFGIPCIGPEGRVAFRARLTTPFNPTGIWSEGLSGMNNLQRIVREGDPVPGLSGTQFDEFSFSLLDVVLNSNGAVAFVADIAGDQNAFGPRGIFRYDHAGLTTVAAPGKLVSLACDGLACQRWLTQILGRLALNDSGAVAFTARIDGTGVNGSNDLVTFPADSGGTHVVVREGDNILPFSGFQFIEGFTTYYPMLNNKGEVVIPQWIAWNGTGSTLWSIWRGTPGDMWPMAMAGSPMPGGGTLVGTGTVLASTFVHSLNDSGQVQFMQYAQNNGVGIPGVWLCEPDGSLVGHCHAGLAAPDGYAFTGAVTSVNPQINAAGDTVFRATIAGPGVNASNNHVLVRHSADGGAAIIARQGVPAPGMGGAAMFSLASFQSCALLNDGRVLFRSVVEGPGVDSSNDVGLWIGDGSSPPRLLVRKGQSMSIGGQIRSVSDIMWTVGSGPESGRANPASDLGQVALRLKFTDSTEAIVVMVPIGSCVADINQDGIVDSDDLSILLANFGHVGDVAPGDLNLDGIVDTDDLGILLGQFGGLCAG